MDDNKIGTVVEGEITHITTFGAFVRLPDGEEGLVHISEIANEYVTDISKFVNVADKVTVKVMARNQKNKLELSMKRAKEDFEEDPGLFMAKKTKNAAFEDRITSFLKKSEEKQIDIRRNLKSKQGITKKRR
jgi:S1 RNA binding domain protein